MLLELIKKENDIKDIAPSKLPALAAEIRRFLLQKISKTGGHLASNLGVVELTMALHLSFDLPKDKIIWDVGHQSYTHKILTGRQAGFDELRKFGGMSGFPKRKESPSDAFDTGHSSTSISAGLGYVAARDIAGDDYYVVSVIGDGAMTGGMAYEALNNASQLKRNFIIILNDNNMSISANVGGMSHYLTRLRTAKVYSEFKRLLERIFLFIPIIGERIVHYLSKTKSGIKQLLVPGMLFENMDITYLGPVDGHNLPKLRSYLADAKQIDGPVIVHVLTTKGKGYKPAESEPSKFHGTEPFDIKTGKPLSPNKTISYTNVFSECIVEEARQDATIVAITAAMPDGTGLSAFASEFPHRFFDVGIAEEHAVTFAAGLAAGGMKPVIALYSSFLQRAYDQTIHDVCLQNLHVIFAIDRGGLVGSDGETHQGLFDLSFLSTIPNMVVMAPKNKYELKDMLRFALSYQGPIAFRYPRGEAYPGLSDYRSAIKLGKSEVIYEEEDIVIFFVGHMGKLALDVRKQLKSSGYNVSLVNARFVKPLDHTLIEKMSHNHQLIVTIEENMRTGGFGEQVTSYVMTANLDLKVRMIAISDEYVEHGNVEVLQHEVGLCAERIVKQVTADWLMIQTS